VPNLVAKHWSSVMVATTACTLNVHRWLYQLCASGKVTNARKSIHRGVSVITFGLGSQEMYDFLDENEKVRFAPVSYVNDPSVIAKNHRMVSINSALEVDLQGRSLRHIGLVSTRVSRSYGLRRRDESVAGAHVADLPPIDAVVNVFSRAVSLVTCLPFVVTTPRT